MTNEYGFEIPLVSEEECKLQERIEELENKIADIKANCDLAIEGRDIKIKELETENNKLLDVINNQDVKIADLEWQLQEVAKDNDYYQAENKRLEKENEELKGSLELYESGGCRATNLFECGVVKELKEQLTKAKEIIKKFSEFANNEIEYNPEHPQEHTDLWNELCEQAEQFLKEIEK